MLVRMKLCQGYHGEGKYEGRECDEPEEEAKDVIGEKRT